MRPPVNDPYRGEITAQAVGPFYRAPFWKRHRKLLLRGSAVSIWVTLDTMFWYWALSWSYNPKGDSGFVAILTLFHVCLAGWLSIHLFLLSRDP